jgi:hypothetical protein
MGYRLKKRGSGCNICETYYIERWYTSNCENKVSEQLPELFHYTTVCAFENIYRERKLRATHYEDLNDITEFAQFKVKLSEYITPKVREILIKNMQDNAEIAAEAEKEGGTDTVVHKLVEGLVSLLHDSMFKKDLYGETFVCCFCAHTSANEKRDGLLSQWRGYASDGVAIVFNTSKIEEMFACEYQRFQLHRALWADVIYDNSDNDPLIRQRFCDVFDYVDRNLLKMFNGEYPPNVELNKLHDGFFGASVRVKHNAFHEENEVRIVVPIKTRDSLYDPDDPRPLKEIRYRQKDIGEARYIELFGDVPLPIERIIVGPSRIQNVNYQRVTDVVHKDVEVIKSTIPLLGNR